MAGRDQALRAARRLTFGPTPALLDDLRGTGVDAWLSRQLDPTSIDDSATDRRLLALGGLWIDIARLLPATEDSALLPLTDRLAETVSSTAMALQELELLLVPALRAEMDGALAELRLATVVRATYSERQLLELMVDHWWNHFNVWPGKGSFTGGFVVEADRKVIRPHALGRFTDLVAASAASPAMLMYLDNWLNHASNPNENFGRELLELHTVGAESGFTERDVHDAARVFSGWTIDLRRGRFAFVPEWHDTGAKRVLDWSTSGRTGSAGVEEGRALLSHLAHHPSTARHLATKLARRFVADEPPQELVASAAAAYLAHDTAIVPVLQHIVASDAFWSSEPKVRRPLELFVAALRSTGAEVGDPIGTSTDAGCAIDATLLALGQRPFDAPAPDGYPDRAGPWLGAGLLGRWATAHELARGDLGGIRIDVPALIGSATTAGSVVDALLSRLHGEIVPERRQTLLHVLGPDESAVVEEQRVPELIGLALSAAELQQR
jgi:uncharacterized protein (DUF1800 family)